MQNVLFRPAGTQDAGRVALLVHALLQELSGGKAGPLEDITATAERLLAEPGVLGFLALADDVPVGVLTLNECAAIYAGGRFGEISELYVVPACRSRGVARHLLDIAHGEAVARGWKRLEVGAPAQPDWRRTLAFYLANDFDEVGPRLRRLTGA